MAITVPFDLAYELEVKASYADVFAVLSDVPTSASHFPKVEKLTDMGGGPTFYDCVVEIERAQP